MTILKTQDVMLLLLKLLIIFSQYFGLDGCQCLCSIDSATQTNGLLIVVCVLLLFYFSSF